MIPLWILTASAQTQGLSPSGQTQESAAPAVTPAAAIAILTSASNALSGGTPLSTVVMTGNASYTAGSSRDSGPVTLEASGFFDSRCTLQLSSGARTEIQQQWSGSWSGPDGVPHAMALHNLMSSSSWFFPPLLVNGWLADTYSSISVVGSEERNGIAVHHLRCARALQTPTDGVTAQLVANAGTMDLFLDSATFLPAAIEFNIHPDNNEQQNIPVRIEFSDYQAAGLGKAPFRIQKFLQNTLLLDITISSVNLNAAIPSTDFPL